jgi:hypothetical protein
VTGRLGLRIARTGLDGQHTRRQGQVVTLDRDGVFSSTGPAGTFHVYCDAADHVGRWVLAAAEAAAVPRLLSEHNSLDEALESLRTACLAPTRDLDVLLPCGRSFSRPGYIDATKVMAGMGYTVAKRIVVYAVLHVPAAADEKRVRAILVDGLAGRAVGIGKLDRVEKDRRTAVWCCDLNLPFEGPLHGSYAMEYVGREFDGVECKASVFKLTDCIEIVPLSPVVAHEAEVIEMRPSIFLAA